MIEDGSCFLSDDCLEKILKRGYDTPWSIPFEVDEAIIAPGEEVVSALDIVSLRGAQIAIERQEAEEINKKPLKESNWRPPTFLTEHNSHDV
ncbi:MAG: hypothetical protein ACE5DQ_01885 [Candidatus Paceibacterota bacterium]